MLIEGETILVNKVPKIVKRWEASWSFDLVEYPHLLWVLWEGETKFQKFTSDNKGSFAELDRP